MQKSRTVGAVKPRTVGDAPAGGRLKIVYVQLTHLKMWEKNPRRNDAASKKLARIIAVHGVRSPIVCTRDNVIRKGNTTYKALLILGHTEAPVIYVDFPTEDQAAMYSIADNRASELSEWDPGLLMLLLGENSKIPLAQMEEMTSFSQPEIMGLRDMHSDGELKEKLPGQAKPQKHTCPECGHVWVEGEKKEKKSRTVRG